MILYMSFYYILITILKNVPALSTHTPSPIRDFLHNYDI